MDRTALYKYLHREAGAKGLRTSLQKLFVTLIVSYDSYLAHLLSPSLKKRFCIFLYLVYLGKYNFMPLEYQKILLVKEPEGQNGAIEGGGAGGRWGN